MVLPTLTLSSTQQVRRRLSAIRSTWTNITISLRRSVGDRVWVHSHVERRLHPVVGVEHVRMIDRDVNEVATHPVSIIWIYAMGRISRVGVNNINHLVVGVWLIPPNHGEDTIEEVQVLLGRELTD